MRSWGTVRRAALRAAVISVAALALGNGAALVHSGVTTAHADSSFDQALFTYINQDRAQAGVPALRWNQQLGDIAEGQPYGGCGFTVYGRAVDMINRNYFSHTICGNQNVFNVMQANGVPYQSAGENIGWESGYTDPVQAAQYLNTSFMNSPAHRANILNVNFTDVGVGSDATAPGRTWSGGGSAMSNVYMAVEDFTGNGQASAPPPPTPGVTGTIAVNGTDNQLWARHPYSGWIALGGVLTSAPAVVTIPSGNGTTDLYIAIGTDHGLWERTDGSGWRPVSPQHTYCLDRPAAAVVGNQLVVACEGGDHAIWYGETTATGVPQVAGFASLGGRTTYGPAVADINGFATFFATGTDNQMWSRLADTGWSPFGGRCTSAPGAGWSGSKGFAACRGTDGALWYVVGGPSGWSGFGSAGGGLTGAPGVAVLPGTVAFTVEGTDGQVYQQVASSTSSSGWSPENGQAQLGVGAAPC